MRRSIVCMKNINIINIPIKKFKLRYKYPKLQPQPCHYKSSPAKDDPKKTSQFFLHMYVPFF